MRVIIATIIISFGISFVLGFLLGVFKKVFAIEVNPLVAKVREVLPGVNCGACGYPGCDGFAAGCVAGEAPTNGCRPGGPKVAEQIGAIIKGAAGA
ncbi:MAG: RnfABCDGE type electron transport complex subunit B [Treponema sp.]|nr:RnfABCDGE type electron transport complex subunit B [Treponema sp.]